MDEIVPRIPPAKALVMLGAAGHEAGFVDFLLALRDDGFHLWQPEDNELSQDEWEETYMSRIRTILTAWDIYKEKINARSN